jgi:hypothetical protein
MIDQVWNDDSNSEIKSLIRIKFHRIRNISLRHERITRFFHFLQSTEGQQGMMMTRARLARRQKVTVRWLPVELIIEIFRRVQKLIGREEFMRWGIASMKLDQEYCNNLLAFALSSKEWSAIAQAELFGHVILENRSRTSRFLDAVRGSEKLSGLCRAIKSLNLGGELYIYPTEGLGDDLDGIALHCPNLIEISCGRVQVRLEYFGTLPRIRITSGGLTMSSAGRKHEEIREAQDCNWMYPTAFDFQSTTSAIHTLDHSIISHQRQNSISS